MRKGFLTRHLRLRELIPPWRTDGKRLADLTRLDLQNDVWVMSTVNGSRQTETLDFRTDSGERSLVDSADLSNGFTPKGLGTIHTVQIIGAIFDSTLDLSYLFLDVRLEFQNCEFRQGLRLVGSRLQSLQIIDSDIGGQTLGRSDGPAQEVFEQSLVSGPLESIGADGLQVAGSFDLVRCNASGQIDLWQAVIGRSVYVTDCTVGHHPPTRKTDDEGLLGAVEGYSASLLCVATRIGGDLVIEGDATNLRGGIILRGAQVRVIKISRGSTIGALHNGVAIDLDAATIGFQVAISGRSTEIYGDIRVRDAQIGTLFSISDRAAVGSFNSPASIVLRNSSIESVSLDESLVIGYLQVVDSDVGALLIDQTTRIASGSGKSTVVHIAGGSFRTINIADFDGDGHIAALGPQIGTFVFHRAAWRRLSGGRSWLIDLASLDRITFADGECSAADLIDWVSNMADGDRGGSKALMYERLIPALREEGLEDEARLLVEAQRVLVWRFWLRALLRPIGLTPRPGRAAIGLCLLMAVTTVVVALGSSNGLFMASEDVFQINALLRASQASGEVMVEPSPGATGPVLDQPLVSNECASRGYPCLEPVAYSLDVLLPVVDLDAERYWTPARRGELTQMPDILGFYLILARLFGWTLLGLFLISVYEQLNRHRAK